MVGAHQRSDEKKKYEENRREKYILMKLNRNRKKNPNCLYIILFALHWNCVFGEPDGMADLEGKTHTRLVMPANCAHCSWYCAQEEKCRRSLQNTE